MTNKSLNGKVVDLTSRIGTPQRRHNGDAWRSQLNGDDIIEDTAGTRRRQLDAAMREIDALVKLNMRLKKESALLAESLANARRFAYHDELTGLPNRRLLTDHFNEAVARAKRQHNSVVLLFLDLDDFKGINDAVGHAAADRLLQQVALRLTACIRGSDTACRYGGDELVVLLTDIDTRDDAVAATEKIRAELTAPYDVDGTPVRMTVSIGIATWLVDGKDCLALIKAADTAMYREKRRPAVAPGRPAATVPAGLEQAIVGWRQMNLVTE
jgi:diguanylate cyclase (GGDEF)-like protein